VRTDRTRFEVADAKSYPGSCDLICSSAYPTWAIQSAAQADETRLRDVFEQAGSTRGAGKPHKRR
jgi:hypothetical protein